MAWPMRPCHRASGWGIQPEGMTSACMNWKKGEKEEEGGVYEREM